MFGKIFEKKTLFHEEKVIFAGASTSQPTTANNFGCLSVILTSFRLTVCVSHHFRLSAVDDDDAHGANVQASSRYYYIKHQQCAVAAVEW